MEVENTVEDTTLNLSQLADEIDLNNADNAVEQESEEQTEAVEDVENGEELEDGDVTDTTEEAEETDEDSDDDKDEDSEQDTETDDDTTSATDTVKIGDKEYTQDELEKGFMRQNDYTKKTQALSEDRKAFESEVHAKTQELENVYAERKAHLESLEQQVLPDYMQKTEQELDDMAEYDPSEFMKVDAMRKRFMEKQAVKQREAQEEQQKLATQQKAYVEQETAKFYTLVPSAKDNPDYVHKIANHAMEQGVPKELLDSIADAGILKAFADSYEFSQLKQKSVDVVKNKVVKKPKMKQTQTNRVTQTNNADKKFNKNPTWENFATTINI